MNKYSFISIQKFTKVQQAESKFNIELLTKMNHCIIEKIKTIYRRHHADILDAILSAPKQRCQLKGVFV